jgi:hypothetical protein
MRVLRPVWALYDRLYGWVHGLEDLPTGEGTYLRTELARYRGRSIRLPDGTVLQPSQRVLLLHLNSRALGLLGRELVSPMRTGLAFRRIFRSSLEALAARLASDPTLADVQAVGAFTTFWQGSERFGFAVIPLRPAWWARIVGAYQLSLTRQHARPRASWPPRRWAHGQHAARTIWISTAGLCRRFARPERRTARPSAIATPRGPAVAAAGAAPAPPAASSSRRRAERGDQAWSHRRQL